mmetsp:Transcript_50431/g.60680  ORF Transcript_50431/g.60680 Transcript_50431/m.60680 type:complete len:212 (+) Transcript_50431:15-650(+)
MKGVVWCSRRVCGRAPCSRTPNRRSSRLYASYRWWDWISDSISVQSPDRCRGTIPLPSVCHRSTEIFAVCVVVAAGVVVGREWHPPNDDTLPLPPPARWWSPTPDPLTGPCTTRCPHCGCLSPEVWRRLTFDSKNGWVSVIRVILRIENECIAGSIVDETHPPKHAHAFGTETRPVWGIVEWIPGWSSRTATLTLSLEGPAFERCTRFLHG